MFTPVTEADKGRNSVGRIKHGHPPHTLGKTKNRTDSVYFMTNPEDLKYEYIKHLPAITINTDVEKLSIKSPEYMQMERENNEYKQKVERMEANIANIMERLGQEEAK